MSEQNQVPTQATIIDEHEQPQAPIETSEIVLDLDSTPDAQSITKQKQYIVPADLCPSPEKKSPQTTQQQSEQMRLTASPFKPSVTFEVTNDNLESSAQEPAATTSHPVAVNVEQPSPHRQVADQLQGKLDKQILLMKAQHQYIQNLQRANLVLKSKVRQLEDLTKNEEILGAGNPSLFNDYSGFPSHANAQDDSHASKPQKKKIMTQGDLVDDDEPNDQYQEMQMVPIGKIEEISRLEEGADRSAGPPYHHHQGPRNGGHQYDQRPFAHHSDYKRQHSRGENNNNHRTVMWRDKENYEGPNQRPQEQVPHHPKSNHKQFAKHNPQNQSSNLQPRKAFQRQEDDRWQHDRFFEDQQNYHHQRQGPPQHQFGGPREREVFYQDQSSHHVNREARNMHMNGMHGHGRGMGRPNNQQYQQRKQNMHVHAKLAAERVGHNNNFNHNFNNNTNHNNFGRHEVYFNEEEYFNDRANRRFDEGKGRGTRRAGDPAPFNNRGRGAHINPNSHKGVIQEIDNRQGYRQRRNQDPNYREKFDKASRGQNGRLKIIENDDEDLKDADTFQLDDEHQNLDMRPSAFYSNVAKKTNQFEADRHFHKKQARPTNNFRDDEPAAQDEFKIKSYENGGFMIQPKIKYADRHCFFDEAQNSPSQESPNNSSPDRAQPSSHHSSPHQSSPQIYEIGAQNDYMPQGMREVKDESSPLKQFDAKNNLLQDFGIEPQPLQSHTNNNNNNNTLPEEELKRDLSQNDPLKLRQRIKAALQAQQEEILSDLIDEARTMGPELYKWIDELDQIEGELIAMTCGSTDPFDQINQQIAATDDDDEY